MLKFSQARKMMLWNGCVQTGKGPKVQTPVTKRELKK